MPRKEDIEPAAADGVLKGLAGRLGVVVNAKADALIAEADAAKETDRLMRDLTLIARAALVVQALQAAEDRAEDPARDREVDRAAAAVRARPLRRDPIHDEGDETEMNDKDPRLDDSDRVGEIYESAQRRVDRIFRHLETKHADRIARDQGKGLGAGPQLVCEVPSEPAAS